MKGNATDTLPGVTDHDRRLFCGFCGGGMVRLKNRRGPPRTYHPECASLNSDLNRFINNLCNEAVIMSDERSRVVRRKVMSRVMSACNTLFNDVKANGKPGMEQKISNS